MPTSPTPNTDCVCGSLRKATRLVTQSYDNALKPIGLLVTQYGVLKAIRRLQPVTMNQLVTAMVMDRTTMTRNLKPLEKQGLIQIVAGADQRTRIITITEKAERLLERAFPLWEKAQKHFMETVGLSEWQVLQMGLIHVIDRFRQRENSL